MKANNTPEVIFPSFILSRIIRFPCEMMTLCSRLLKASSNMVFLFLP